MAANLRDDVAINNVKPHVSDRVIIFDMCHQHEMEGWYNTKDGLTRRMVQHEEKSRFTLHFETPFKDPTFEEDYDEDYYFQWHLYTFHDGNGEFLITLNYELDLVKSEDIIYKFNAKTNKLSYFSSSDNVTYNKNTKIVSFPSYEKGLLGCWDVKAQTFVNKNTD